MAYARSALAYGFEYLGLSRNDEVLVPAYICDVVLTAFNKLGLKPIFYPVNYDFSIDVTQVEALLSKNTKAIIMLHYFGFPCLQATEIQNFAKANDLFLVEDCAHSFLTDGIGHIGDVTVYSHRKMLPILNGASLRINNMFNCDKITSIENKIQELAYEKNGRKSFKKAIERFFRTIGLNSNVLKNKKKKLSYQHGVSENEFHKYRIDKTAFRFIQRLNVKQEAEKIRKNYGKTVENLLSQGFKPVFCEVGDTVVPWGCPVWTERQEQDFVRLSALGYRVSTWPSLPTKIANEDFYIRLHQKFLIVSI